MIRWIFSGVDIRSFRLNFGLAIVRIFSGLGIALGHGIGKIPVSEGLVESIDKLGFPFPVFFAWGAALSEFGGGLLLTLGLGTRPVSLFLFLTMAGVAFLHHAEDPFARKEKVFLYLVIFLFFFLVGSGKYGIDNAIRNHRAKKYLL